MPRFLVTPGQIHGPFFTLSGPEAHHALAVLRKKVGDILDLFDGENRSFRGRIERISGGEILGRIEETDAGGASLPVQLTLYPALIRGPKWDWLLEKASEIGVSCVTPVLAARCVVKPSSHESHKIARWRRIAQESAKQCGRAAVMAVDSPVSLADAFHKLPKGVMALIPWEKEPSRSVRDVCRGFSGKVAHVFIGPEGGWEPSEIKQAEAAGVVPVRLGPTLLRSETAGLVAATVVLTELGVYA